MYVLRVPYLAIVWVGAIVTNLSCPFRLLYVEFQAEGFGLQQIRDGQQIFEADCRIFQHRLNKEGPARSLGLVREYG